MNKIFYLLRLRNKFSICKIIPNVLKIRKFPKQAKYLVKPILFSIKKGKF